jgi:hypothetical protein
MTTTNPNLRPYAALVGTWASRGRTVDGPAVEILGLDHYEWLAGGHFLVHKVLVRVGDDPVEALEVIGGHDPGTDTLAMRAFDNSGAITQMRAAVRDDGTFAFSGSTERTTLRVAEDGRTMAAHWERSEDGATWRPWMDMSFTRLA